MVLGSFFAIALLRAAVDSGASADVRRLALGESTMTDQGNELTVYGWTPRSASEPALSEIDVKSCRTSPDQPLIKAGAFALELANGKTLEPQGSELQTVENCIKGNIFFPPTKSESPRSVVFNGGSVRLSWTVADG